MPHTAHIVFRLFVLTLLLSLGCGSRLAKADFSAAQREFAQRSPDERAEIISALIASGVFNGIYDGQYSPRIQTAIEAISNPRRLSADGTSGAKPACPS